jgi:hypothetical protein
VALVGFLAVGPGVGRSTQTVATAVIEGRVLSAEESPVPVHAARIVLRGATDFRAITDDEGQFVVSDVSPGRYVLEVSKPGFVVTQYGALAIGAAGTPLDVEAGSSVSLVVRMPRSAALSGTIRDVSGRPIPNLRVSAGDRTATTDDLGQYRIWGLTPGRYRIAAIPPASAGPAAVLAATAVTDWLRRASAGESAALRIGPTMQAASITRSVTYSPVYYPGTVDMSSAASIEVAPGQEQAGLDFAMVWSDARRISGRVDAALDASPSSSDSWRQSLSVTLTDRNGLPLEGPRPVVEIDRPTGRFDMLNVSPGTYRIEARVSSLASRQPLRADIRQRRPIDGWARLPVDVGGSDLVGLVLQLRSGLTVSGRVNFDAAAAGSRRANSRVVLSDVSHASAETTRQATAVGQIGPDGEFKISDLMPDDYRLTVESADGTRLRIRAASGAPEDLVSRPLGLSEDPKDVTGLTIAVTDHHTVLDGWFQNRSGAPVSDFAVVVFPRDRRQWDASSTRLASVRPSTAGRYAFSDLPPGDYFLAAVRVPAGQDWREPDFLEKVVAISVAVTVFEDKPTTQGLLVEQ